MLKIDFDVISVNATNRTTSRDNFHPGKKFEGGGVEVKVHLGLLFPGKPLLIIVFQG